MKYVKIYDEKMLPIGVIDIDGDLSAASGKYVKVIGANMQPAGVIKLGNEMSEAQKALLFQAYDQNLMLVGVGTAGSLSPTPVDPTAIDLGLPSGTLWRSMNLGAESPTDYGLYFQWGDTQGYTADQVGSGEGKKAFDDYYSDYKFGNLIDGFTKYNETDRKTTLDPEDDAAHVMLGGNWVMPTKTQFDELLNSVYTTTEWVNNYQGSGIEGLLVTSKSDGSKSVFFPAAGYADNSSVGEDGIRACYWSASRNEVTSAYGVVATGTSSVAHHPRSYGYSIRPVQVTSV